MGIKVTNASKKALEMGRHYGLLMTSGYRSPAHNAEVGGANGSDHTKGLAYDFAGPRASMLQFADWAYKSGMYTKVIFDDHIYGTSIRVANHTDHVHVSWSANGSKESNEPSGGVAKEGNIGGIIKAIQKLLGIQADGFFGPATRQAVENFQENNKLAVDGVVGNKTWGEMTSGASFFFHNGYGAGGDENSESEEEDHNQDGENMSFFTDMKPYAVTAGAATNIPWQVIVAQWAEESAFGKSDLCQRAKNFAGIKYNSHADFKSGAYAGYNSLSSFTRDYIRVMKLDYYKDVRAADGIPETVAALGRSPYAGNPQYGPNIAKIIKDNDLGDAGPGVDLVDGAGDAVTKALGSKVGSIIFSPLFVLGIGIMFVFKK